MFMADGQEEPDEQDIHLGQDTHCLVTQGQGTAYGCVREAVLSGNTLRIFLDPDALEDGVNIKELSEYLGHHDPGFTLQMYTHMLPSSYDRARQAVDRRLERLASRLTEQGRSSENSTAA